VATACVHEHMRMWPQCVCRQHAARPQCHAVIGTVCNVIAARRNTGSARASHTSICPHCSAACIATLCLQPPRQRLQLAAAPRLSCMSSERKTLAPCPATCPPASRRSMPWPPAAAVGASHARPSNVWMVVCRARPCDAHNAAVAASYCAVVASRRVASVLRLCSAAATASAASARAAASSAAAAAGAWAAAQRGAAH
jgi:hypothetical protein